MAATVAVVRCETYETGAVHAAVGRALDLLGGAGTIVAPGERILLKPNLLVPSRPEDAVTTHPAVFEATIRHLLDAGALLSFGDSPAFGGTEVAARRAGLTAVAEKLGVGLEVFREGRAVPFPEGRLIKRFEIADQVLEADGLISLPKLKTHALTRLTCAVKNQFGCVPGMRKGEFHAKMSDIRRFAQMLVDLNRLIAPRLAIVDAIVGMEGNGPRGGDPRAVGLIIASRDMVAADAVAASVIDLPLELVETCVIGHEWGLGEAYDIRVVGEPIDAVRVEGFSANRSRASTTPGPRPHQALMKRWMTPRPTIRAERCTRCGTCVTMCPVSPKAVDWHDGDRSGPPSYRYERCIRCYCCQEMCPERAIDVRTPLASRLFRR